MSYITKNNPRSAMCYHLKNEEGSATVEFSIMMPVYVLLVMMTLFMGGIGLSKIDLVRASAYMASTEGAQGEGDLPENYFANNGVNIFNTPGSFTAFSDTNTGEELYYAGTGDGDQGDSEGEYTPAEDPYDLNDALMDVAYNPVGHYEWQNGELVYVINDNPTADAAFILENEMLAELPRVSDLLNNWMLESNVSLSYTFSIPFEGFETELSHEGMALFRASEDRGGLPEEPTQGMGAIGMQVFNEMITSDEYNNITYDQFKYPDEGFGTEGYWEAP